jgi:hypothetical protein
MEAEANAKKGINAGVNPSRRLREGAADDSGGNGTARRRRGGGGRRNRTAR